MSMQENTDTLNDYLQSLPRLLMIQTQEEDRLIEQIHEAKGDGDQLKVWNPAFGVLESGNYIDEWSALNHPQDREQTQINRVLIEAYQEAQAQNENNLYYMFLDSDRYIEDDHVQRRLKNIAVSSSHNDSVLRTVILVSENGDVPAKLDPYVEVLNYDDPSDDLIRSVLQSIENEIKSYDDDFTIPHERDGDEIPEDFIEVCRGLTVFQIKERVMHYVFSNDLQVTTDDMREYRKEIIRQTDLLELMQPDVDFDDIAGLENLKERLNEIQTAFTPEGKEFGVPPSRGLLQVGVPGCGKSLTSKALANEMGVTFIKFDPGSLFSSRVGDSERNMRQAIRYIEAVSPCVVFIDEIEKGLAGIQSSSRSDSGTTARVIGTFLSWFEDHDEDVFVIATANGVQDLPPEMISRFEEKFFVGLPAEEAREECFRIQAEKYWEDPMGDKDDLDFEKLAQESEQLTGREIEQALMDGIRKAFVSEDQELTTEILLDVIENKPPLVQTMHEQIQELLEWVGWDPERKDGIRAKFASLEGVVEADIEMEDEDVVFENSGSRMNSLLGDGGGDAE